MLSNLGKLYYARGEFAKAEPLLQEALRIPRKVIGQALPSQMDRIIISPDCCN
jgi:Flp pilus assembly protein TadD